MSYLFYLVIGVLWGLGCGYCDARGIMRNDRTIMQLLAAVVAYLVASLLFWGQPAGGIWIIHVIEVVAISGIVHNVSRARLARWFANRN